MCVQKEETSCRTELGRLWVSSWGDLGCGKLLFEAWPLKLVPGCLKCGTCITGLISDRNPGVLWKIALLKDRVMTGKRHLLEV